MLMAANHDDVDLSTNEYDQKITGDTGLTDGDDVTVIANAIKAFNRPIDPQSITSGIKEIEKNVNDYEKFKKNIIIGASVSGASIDILLIISISFLSYMRVFFDFGDPDYAKPKSFAMISGIYTASFTFTPVLIANQIEKAVLNEISNQATNGKAKEPDDKTKAKIDLSRLISVVGIAISSAIAVFVLKGKQAATVEAKNCSYVLFMSFILIASTSISLEDFNIVQTIGGFLIFGFIAAILSATTADSGIKKLFDIYIPQKGKEEDAEEMKKREAKKGNGIDWSPILILASSMSILLN